MSKTIVKYLILFAILVGGTFADFQTKRWAENNLKGKNTITISKSFLNLGFAENRGMVFGILNNKMPTSSQTILTIVRLLILAGLSVYIVMNRNQATFFLLPFLLFWAGAVGNIIDPFIYGYVVDFIHIHLGNLLNWPFYFNLADAYVTIGIVLMLINGSIYKKPVQKNQT